MNQPARSYGLLIRKHRPHGTLHVDVELVCREGDREAPLGVNMEYYWPKHLKGFELDGLGMHGFVSDTSFDDHDGKLAFIGFGVEYHNVYTIVASKAARMLKTLKRIEAAIDKARAYEPGDKLATFAESLKLEFVVEDRRERFTDERRWLWLTVPEGRNRYRQLIEEARSEETERRGGMKVKVAS